MALVPEEAKNVLKQFIVTANKTEQKDLDAIIDQFCGVIEQIVYSAVKSATITILPGQIQTAGSATAQANPAPIVLENAIT